MTLCACGCGQPTPLALRTRTEAGHVRGQPIRFIPGHQGRIQKQHAVAIEYPTDAVLWRSAARTWTEWADTLGISEAALRRNANARGWVKLGGQSGRWAKAPCAR